MDVRIDALATFGLSLGDAHVIRNAGGRVTDDVVRSLIVSTHLLGVHSVVVLQHTGCGLAGVTEEELRSRTQADHASALKTDVEARALDRHLGKVELVAGLLYDVDSGRVELICWWSRRRAIEDLE
jgi:carbonic anhydrase